MSYLGLVKRLGLALALVLGSLVLPSALRAAPTASAAGSGYVSLDAPARLLDTRADGATVDNQFVRLGARPTGGTLALTVGGRAGIPSDAAAVVLNVTAVEATFEGYLTVFPCGQPQPQASSLNHVSNQAVPNLVIAKVGNGGQVCLFNTSTVELIVDVAGYFPGTDALTALTPARVLDTRPGEKTIDGKFAGGGIRPAGTVQTLDIAGRAGVPAGAASAVLNVTVTGPQAPGYFSVYPCDSTRPTASNLNYSAGQTVANTVVSRISAVGTVCLFSLTTTHLVVDVGGFFRDASTFTALDAPARLLDTRPGEKTIDGTFAGTGRRPPGGTLQLSVAGRASIPAGASAVVLNVTVDQARGAGFVTAYPAVSANRMPRMSTTSQGRPFRTPSSRNSAVMGRSACSPAEPPT